MAAKDCTAAAVASTTSTLTTPRSMPWSASQSPSAPSTAPSSSGDPAVIRTPEMARGGQAARSSMTPAASVHRRVSPPDFATVASDSPSMPRASWRRWAAGPRAMSRTTASAPAAAARATAAPSMGDTANRVRRTSVSRVETADSMSGSIPYRYRAFLNWSRVAGAFWSATWPRCVRVPEWRLKCLPQRRSVGGIAPLLLC